MKAYALPLAHHEAILETVGGKGASLARLAIAGLPVPDGFHVTTAAYRQFIAENDLQPRILHFLQQANPSQPGTLETVSRAIQELLIRAPIPTAVSEAIELAYASLPGVDWPAAVRSSATAEDLPELSFAGQQDTYLNVHGIHAVLEAVRKCWASLWTARAMGYRMQHKIDQDAVALAVVVQTLVPAQAAGILFTANPMNGKRDEMLINAAWGLGEAVVGGKVTPDTYTVAKQTGAVIQVVVAEKAVMTVRTEIGTQEHEVPQQLSKAQVLQDAQIKKLTELARQIEVLYQSPQDIEWCWADGEFFIVQSRPITALPEAEATIAFDWIPPNPKGIYIRGSLVDLLPDPLSPLFASLGLTGAMAGVARASRILTHSEPVLPADYFTTLNSYGYMNASLPARSWWWVITRMLPAYPRILREGLAIWRDEVGPNYKQVISDYREVDPKELPTAGLWRAIQEMTKTSMYYVGTLLYATMGAAAGSEALMTQLYNKIARQAGDPPATTLVMGYNSIPVQADKSLYDLAQWCRERQELANYLLKTPSSQIAKQLSTNQVPSTVGGVDWQELRLRLEHHLNQFGHIIYELDFAKPLPLDDPAPMLETCKMYLRGQGVNPHERQRLSEEKRIQTGQTILGRLKGLRLWIFRKALNWAQSLAEVREDALAGIGLGYPFLRRLLWELGQRFTQAGVILHDEDIFWLEKDEVEATVVGLENGLNLESLTERVEQRKKFWKAAKRQTPPPMIPMKKKFWGFNTNIWMAEAESEQVGNTLKGVAASMGTVTARARVLHGPEDFDQMQPGEVLVAGTTTPAWTPLFAMASAVVTDIGGPLSHGSIVAREYGIPAVMGTGVATRRIHTGQLITVDGNAGKVSLNGAH